MCKQTITYLEELLQLREDAIVKDIFHPKSKLIYNCDDKMDIIKYRGKFGVDTVYTCPKCNKDGELYL